MSITSEKKSELIQTYQRQQGDTGSPEVQIAMLSHRINALTEHLKSHNKDHASRRGLLMMVSRRRTLLDYLKRIQPESYKKMIQELGLRK